ncbi:MAG: transcriptional regulator, partial [Methanosarcinaceae archaeon]|nr:transcriptional regulator [Methanosarcinaceae archaeon]
ATSIVCLTNGQEFTSREIESISGLRQPEISIAMRDLLENEWIEVRNVKKSNGKGRPTKIYRLIVTLEDIIKKIESQIQIENETRLNDIVKLKHML